MYFRRATFFSVNRKSSQLIRMFSTNLYESYPFSETEFGEVEKLTNLPHIFNFSIKIIF